MVRKGHQPPSGPPSPRVGSTFSKILLGQEELEIAPSGAFWLTMVADS